jgi:hypothetical protein
MSTDLSRQHRRHAFRASCIVRSTLDGRLVGDRTLDVSYAGMRVASVGAARVGERVTISFEIPGSRVWMSAKGRIERVLEGRRAGDEGPALGVRIEGMNGFDRWMLASIARGLPEIPATRGGRRDYARTIARITEH